MLITIIGLIRFGFSLIFGIAVTALFAGIEMNKTNRLSLSVISIIFLVIQTISWRLVGIELTSKIYPLITHLPLIFILTYYFKKPWLKVTVSVLTGYLCCQAPRWVGFLAGSLFNHVLADYLFYMAAVVVSYYVLKKYVVASVRELMDLSLRSSLFLGAVPLFYYLFDYITAIYTDVLYRGTKWAVQFMPSTISVFYFVFVVLYYLETQKQAQLQRERDMLDTQFRLAQTEFNTLKTLQDNAAAYRHDMRHHFNLLQSLAINARIDDIVNYLNAAQQDMDTITPVRYCENETVNLILSAYVNRASSYGIETTIDASLPDELPFSDTELCSLLSNAFENAIHATSTIADVSKRVIQLRIYEKNHKLCIDLKNRIAELPEFANGMPCSKVKGHGFGTKSMAHIIEKHHGVFVFTVKDDWFVFQATA